MTPRPFAPGIITTDDEEGSSGFARSGTVFLFQKFRDRRCHTYITRLVDGVWTAPELIPFWETMVHNGDFVISSDDRTMLYQVKKEADPLLRSDLWRAEITETGWREGTPLPSPVNTADNDESYASDTAAGDLYFFSNRPGGKGRFDLYACPFKDGAYGEAVNLEFPEHGISGMGPVRRPGRELSPLLLHQAGRVGRGRPLYLLQGQGRRVGIARPSGPGGQLPGFGEPAVRHARREIFFLHLDPERQPGHVLGSGRISRPLQEEKQSPARSQPLCSIFSMRQNLRRNVFVDEMKETGHQRALTIDIPLFILMV